MKPFVKSLSARILVVALVLALLPPGFLKTPQAHAEPYIVPIINDSFDSGTQPQGWAVKNANDAGNTAVLENGKLKLMKSTANTNYLSLDKSLGTPFTPGVNHDRLGIEYKVQVVRSDGAAIGFPLLTDAANGNKQPFNGQIVPGSTGLAYKIHNGSVMQNVYDPTDPKRAFVFDPGQEYTFKHVLNYESGKHDLYINGNLVASQFQFLNPVTASDKISLILGGKDVEILLDDFKVYRITDVPPTTDPLPQYPGFPVYQASKNKLLTGGVGGFGMLAAYAAPGPGQVLVRRTTQVPAKEPFKPIALARVFDPEGRLVAWHEFTDQSTGTAEQTLDIPDGPAGIYRVSFSGGRDGDLLEIALPETEVWGVRGEMALGVTATTPRTSYLYLPRTVNTFFMESMGIPTARVYDDQGAWLGTPANHNGRFTFSVNHAPADTVWQLQIDAASGEALVFDGVPALLTPTKEAALALKGGTVEADGLLVAGPVQAKVRNAMKALQQEDLTVNLTFPTEVPADLENPIVEALNYGKYGFLMGMKPALDRQTMNADSPYYGAILDVDPNNKPNPIPEPLSWETFLHPAILSPWDAENLATAVATPGTLNPAYGNRALANRAALAAMYHLVSTQGDDYIRENNLQNGTAPLTHAFFVYRNVAKTFALIKDDLSPAVRDAYRDALISTGDRMGDYKGYQSNQWLHTIDGHLYTYLATGEARFLGYFERMMTSYVEGTHGANSKFGQHPAGYFLEEYGPDGNYGSMNEYELTSLYYEYRELPEAKPALAEKMRNAIQKDLEFQSYYWLPQPSGVANGTFLSPSAMNARTLSYLSVPSYPGLFLAHPDFPLALARYNKIKEPAAGAGDAQIFPHLINNEDWAKRLLEWAIPKKDTFYDNTNGTWASDLHKAYERPDTVEPAVLPVDQQRGTWTLPGNVAWKRGNLYGAVFYDITGADAIPAQSRVGGGPTVFWSEGTGTVVNSTKNSRSGAVNTVDDLSFTGIYGYDNNGNLFSSGKERSSFNWIEEGESFEIKSALASPGGDLTWKYELGDDATTITVTLNAIGKLHDTYLNLPIAMKEPGAVVEGPSGGTTVFRLGDSSMTIALPEGTAAGFGADISTFAGTVKPLRIALPADGTPLTFRLYADDGSDVPDDGASTAAPGKPVLSNDNGYDTGLMDGNYKVTMNMWHGDNGSLYKLYENDVLIDKKKLADLSPSAQTAETAIGGRKNGVYRYVAELANRFGTARSDTMTVEVTDAAPGKPVLSNDNWDHDGNFKVVANLWWGTNGTTYKLYENGILIDTQTLADHTPSAQTAATTVTGRPPGVYEYRAELVNDAGTVSSDKMIVQVNG
ncbi:hypothetical protein [Cohnella nanjingensis]|uniref:Uncharacterized protein n=1 Tax=Cohnella nanjingensis TaxID=1387779 RepID=A0A7X0RWM5_9BACL|nr:hypothetical protein [Cohnella nanjingensis]MBB6673816.1 hypothetical protein [Cohnella nanjingensis]